MPGPMFPYTDLSADQAIQQSFDEANDRLRVDAVVTATIGEVKITDGTNDATLTQVGTQYGLDVNILNDLYVNISHLDDSVRLGDGTNYITSTTIGADNGLDVNVINPITATLSVGSEIKITDGTDTLDINADGSLNVQITDNTIRTAIISFNEITAVVSGSETTILTYTVPVGKVAYLVSIDCSGTNIAYYKILHGITTIGKQYTNFGNDLTTRFDFNTNIKEFPGYKLLASETVTIRVRHDRPYIGDFTGRLEVIEIT